MPQPKRIPSSIVLIPMPSYNRSIRSIPRSICLRELHQTPACYYATVRGGEWDRRARKLNHKIMRHSPTGGPRPVQLTPKWRETQPDPDTDEWAIRRRKKQPQSPAAQKKKAIRDVGKNLEQARQDMGLAPTTWIPPTGENYWMLWTNLATFNALATFRYWGRQIFYNGANKILLMYSRYELFGPQIPFFYEANRRAAIVARPDKTEIVQTALDKHVEIFTAFAEARIADIENMCLEGLSESMRKRMARRHRDDVLRWLRKPESVSGKFVSWKQNQLPYKHKEKYIYVQQAVVRITSAQQLLKGRKQHGDWTEAQKAAGDDILWDSEGATVREAAVEYLVLQRRLLNLEPSKWAVWGFADETTLENFESTAFTGGDVETKVKDIQDSDLMFDV